MLAGISHFIPISNTHFCMTAGKIFVLSLPLTEKSKKYADFLIQIKDSDHIKFSGEKNGHIMLLNDDSEIAIKTIIIAEFEAPLAYLFNASKSIVNAGIIDDRKISRLFINECYNAENLLMKTFTGDTEDRYFSIIFKEFPEEKYESLTGLFYSQMISLK
jgi:hypothetical protein